MKDFNSKSQVRVRTEPREGSIPEPRSNNRARIRFDKLDSELVTRVLGAAGLIIESLKGFEG